MFGTSADFTISSTGGIYADGQSGQLGNNNCSGSGGGAGGALWFSVSGVWTNNGTVGAQGAPGGAGSCDGWNFAGGAGSGGYVIVNASQINPGTILVSSAGGQTYNGVVVLKTEGDESPEPAAASLLPIPLGGLLIAAAWRRGNRGHSRKYAAID
jgi:hypothetical protein